MGKDPILDALDGSGSGADLYYAFAGTPEERKAKKRAKYNKALYGSETLTPDYKPSGELTGYNSSLTGWWYATLDEALADEQLFKSDPRKWDQAGRERMRALTDPDPGVPDNPNADLTYDEAVGGTDGTGGTGAPAAPDVTGMTPGAPAPAAGLNKSAIAGFTDLLPQPKVASPAVTRTSGSRMAPAVPDPMGAIAAGFGQAAPPETYSIQPGQAPPGAPAPTINRDRINAVLDPLQGYANELYLLGKDNTGLSAAEAQLNKAHELAKLRAADELRLNQQGALGQARSARNPADRALLERVAVGEQAYLGQESQRQQHAADTQLGLDLAILRAQEEDADNKFRLEAISKAAELGLNVAALEVDISKVNLESATNWINQEFQQLLADKQITEQQYEALLDFSSKNADRMVGFTRDMAAIQLEYDKLSVEDRNEADRLLMEKYKIDEQTFVALKQIKEAGKFKWDEVLTAFVGGAATGGTSGLVNVIGGDK